jgi:hypothetical protein
VWLGRGWGCDGPLLRVLWGLAALVVSLRGHVDGVVIVVVVCGLFVGVARSKDLYRRVFATSLQQTSI